MLFHEVYGSYYTALAAILKEAAAGELTEERLNLLVRQKAFAESVLTIPQALKSHEWPLLTDQMRTPLRRAPSMPLTLLQRRWLKGLLTDPRVRLFDPPDVGLEGVTPLFTPEDFVYFDRYADGDDFTDPAYIAHFRTMLSALRKHRRLTVTFISRRGKTCVWNCIPRSLEYSEKDDKFRLRTSFRGRATAVNVSRVTSCEMRRTFKPAACPDPEPDRETLTLLLTDERNTLERAMLHFSHLEKETERLDDTHYLLTLHYSSEDETELIIRVLSFGPTVKAVAPESFVAQLRERVRLQSAQSPFPLSSPCDRTDA